MTTSPRLIDAFIDRLIELAAGAEPENRFCGICNDLRATFNMPEIYQWMAVHFDKLPDAHALGDKWSGPRGKRRRKLCYDVAVQAK